MLFHLFSFVAFSNLIAILHHSNSSIAHFLAFTRAHVGMSFAKYNIKESPLTHRSLIHFVSARRGYSKKERRSQHMAKIMKAPGKYIQGAGELKNL